MHALFDSAFHQSWMEPPEYMFRRQPGGGQLQVRRGRRVQVLELQQDRLQLRSFNHRGQPCATRQPLDLSKFAVRIAKLNQRERDQLFLFSLDPDGAAIREFVRLIPAELWQRIQPYPAGMQLLVLQLFLHAGERALWLHDHESFGLVAVLASAHWLLRRPVPAETLRAWLTLPQHEILQQLGLPGTPRVARVLRKVPAASCSYPTLRNLRLLHDAPLAREVSHLPRITNHVLDALAYVTPRRILTANCLRELSLLDEGHASAMLYQLSALMLYHRNLEKLLGDKLPLPTFHSPLRVQFPDRLVHYKRSRVLKGARRVLPAPPFVDEPGLLTWIRTPYELLREGRQMHNCVFSYLNRIAQRNAAAARVQHGDTRATLVIVRPSARKPWRIEDARVHGDDEAPKDLLAALVDWLARRQGVPRSSVEPLAELPY